MTERGVSFDTNDAFVRPLVEGSTRMAIDLYAEHATAAGVAPIVAQIHDFAGEMARTLTDRVEAVRRLPLACVEGCSYCCRGTPVLVSAPEALALAAHLRLTRTPDELETLRARVDATHARMWSSGIGSSSMLLVQPRKSVAGSAPLASGAASP